MLKLTNVSAGYGSGDVIKNINLSIEPGCNLSIIGPNGCGKSTLLKVMAGILPYRGEITLDGQPLNRMKRGQIAGKIAMLSQISPLTFSYTVYDTVMMGRYRHSNTLLGAPTAKDKEVVANCLQAVEMLEVGDRDITKLSGGQLQRVFLARTLAQEPDIILLDEPTNHLDLKYQIELIDYLKNHQASRSIIGVLHDINQAMRLSENFLILKNGQELAHGRNILTDELLNTAYGIDVAAYMRETLARWLR